MPSEPRILYWDVEKSFKLGYFYDQWNTNIPHSRIKTNSFMFSAAWMWEHEQVVHSVSVLDDKKKFKKNFRDDSHVARTIRAEINKADAIVAHNGDKFDVLELNTILAKHRMKPTIQPIQIDTLSMAKKHFRYDGGNSLANLCNFYDLPVPKSKITDEIWIEAAEGDVDAIKYVQNYNEFDIPCLRDLFILQRPFAPAKLNMNQFTHEDVCPSCGTLDWHKNGTQEKIDYHRTRITVKQKWACKQCGYSIVDKKAMKSVRLR